MDVDRPVTPRQRREFDSDTMHDSPFSDYRSDDTLSRSVRVGDSMQTMAHKHLLARFTAMSTRLSRQSPSSQMIESMETGLDTLEQLLDGHTPPQSGFTAKMYDSGLIMQDDDDDADNAQGLAVQSIDVDGMPHPTQLAVQDALLKEAKTVLERVTRANHDLTARFDEMRQLNDYLMDQVETSAGQVLTLRSETESLKAGLVFDHSELLFLKLQLKALEVEAEESGHRDSPGQEMPTSLDNGIRRLKGDSEDVEARFRSRRELHQIKLSSPLSPKAQGTREDGKDDDDQGDWELDMCRKRKGRVHSIVISRRDTLGPDATVTDVVSGAITHESDADDDDQQGSVKHNQSIAFESDPFVDRLESISRAYCSSCARRLPDGQSGADEEAPLMHRPVRVSAWQNLCDSLAAYAGMPDQ